jgi:hypothetical protein
MGEILQAKGSPDAQALGAKLLSAAKLRLLQAKRLDDGLSVQPRVICGRRRIGGL